MRFGMFMAPFHPAGQNPTLALERDLDLIVDLDRLGFDEVWVGFYRMNHEKLAEAWFVEDFTGWLAGLHAPGTGQ